MTTQDTDALYELAGEYVLGVLDRPASAALEQRLGNDAELRAAVAFWNDRLLGLTRRVAPLEPSPQLWTRIEQALSGPVPARPARAFADWWNSLPLWRGLTAAAASVAVVLGLTLLQPVGMPEPQYMVVLVAPEDKAPGFVVQADAHRQVRLIPLGMLEVPSDKALELWTQPEGWNAPRSLGLVQAGRSRSLALDTLPLGANQMFAISLEPAGGSPTGAPTGPVLYVGKTVQLSL